MQLRQKLGLILGFTFFFGLLVLPNPDNMNPMAMRALAVSVLMAIFWVTEAIPVFVTSFLPIALYPLLGVLNSKQIAASYGHHIVLLIMGAFFVAKAIETNGLHKRIALSTIRLVGTSRKKIVLSFMIATSMLSMWTSNNSTTLMMLPIGLAIIAREKKLGADIKRFSPALMLCIAYSASIGGTGTLVGTPPNLLFISIVEEIFPQAPKLVFLDWLMIGLPFVIIFIPLAWIYLIKFFSIDGTLEGSSDVINKEYRLLGPMSVGEKRVATIILFYALGFVFREQWASLIGAGSFVKDSTVAFLTALVLFMMPSGRRNSNGVSLRLLSWEDAKEIPWGIAYLIGGGLAMASAFSSSGLIVWISNAVNLEGIPILLVLTFVVGGMVFLTEINSNAATTAVFLPVLAGLSKAGGFHPYLLMIPATIAASCAFMLPSGTGPNASIMASNHITIPEMARAGFGLNILVIITILILLYTIIIPFFGISSIFPDWAQ